MGDSRARTKISCQLMSDDEPRGSLEHSSVSLLRSCVVGREGGCGYYVCRRIVVVAASCTFELRISMGLLRCERARARE